MRGWATFLKAIMWIVLVVCAGFQILAAIGIADNNSRAAEAGQADKIYPVWPLIAVVAVMAIALLLFILWKKHPLVGLGLAFVAGVAAVVLAFDLMRFFPVQIDVSGERGLDTFKMIYRHMGFAVIPVLMLIVFFLERAATKQEQAWLMEEGKKGYDLSGSAIFKDGSTLGLPAEQTEEETTTRREKRSVRTAKRKRERY